MDQEIFCAGHSFLGDGKLLVTGGRYASSAKGPLINYWFDPFASLSQAWAKLANLHDPIICEPNAPNGDNPAIDCVQGPKSGPGFDCTGRCLNGGRYYPTNVSLTLITTNLNIPDAVLTFSGTNKNSSPFLNNSVEVFDRTGGLTGAWTIISKDIPIDKASLLYPRMTLFPDGKVFYSGHEAQSYLFDPSRSLGDPLQWTPMAVNTNERDQGTSVLLPLVLNATGTIINDATVLTIGGCDKALDAFCHPPGVLNSATKYTRTSNSWSAAGTMTTARQMHNAVLLPDGKVVVVGGESSACNISLTNQCPGQGNECLPVYTGELYNPLTNAWTQIYPPPADQQRPRQYHSGAILLPDTSILIVGGETDTFCYPVSSAQIYKPGYFFRPDTRPTFDSQNPFPNGNRMIYGQTFTINAPNANSIAKVVLIRTSSVTHSFNSDQRYLELNIASRTASSLVVNAPANPNIAPLGYYMVFLVKETTPGDINTRIPSEAKFVRLVTSSQSSSASRPPR